MSLISLPTLAPSSTGELQGRVVLVSGAHGGLGSVAAPACARAGATVVLLGRKLPKLNRVYDACAAVGAEPLLYPMDLEGASPDDFAELASRIESELGRLDGLLHCAANFKGLVPLELTDPADFARALHINLTAPWWLTQACLPLLRQAEDASVVFLLNDVAQTGRAYWGGYGVAQPALQSLVSMLSAELASSAVRVSGLRPGPMRTGLRSKAYVDDAAAAPEPPEAYADACVSLLSPAGASRRGAIWELGK